MAEVGIMAVLSCTFILSPLLGTLVTLVLAWIVNNWRFAKFTTVILVLFLWCVESTRTFSMSELGDFPGYMSIFDDLGKIPLWKLVITPSVSPLESSIEYGWQVFNRIGCVFFGDFLHFAYCVIALSYLLIFASYYKYSKSIHANFRYYLCSICFLAFLSQYFIVINNLLSQQLAMSFVIYALVAKNVDNKNLWYILLLFLIAVSLHGMCIAFLPFFFVKLDKRPTIKLIVIAAVIFAFAVYILQRVSFFSFINIGMIQKFATASDYQGEDVMGTAATISYLIIASIMYIDIMFVQKSIDPNTKSMMNIAMIMALLYVVLEPLPLLQTRYYITRLVFLPFVLPYLLNKNNFLGDLYTVGIIILFVFLFFNTEYENFNFTFSGLLTNTIFHYSLF